jgi:hypothetical protein
MPGNNLSNDRALDWRGFFAGAEVFVCNRADAPCDCARATRWTVSDDTSKVSVILTNPLFLFVLLARADSA